MVETKRPCRFVWDFFVVCGSLVFVVVLQFWILTHPVYSPHSRMCVVSFSTFLDLAFAYAVLQGRYNTNELQACFGLIIKAGHNFTEEEFSNPEINKSGKLAFAIPGFSSRFAILL